MSVGTFSNAVAHLPSVQMIRDVRKHVFGRQTFSTFYYSLTAFISE